MRLFSPGSTFYVTQNTLEVAHRTWGDIEIGPFVISRATYQKTNTEKAIQFLSLGDPALSSLSLRSYRFKYHVNRNAVSWERVVTDTELPPAAHVLSLFLLIAWAVYYIETGVTTTRAAAWSIAVLSTVAAIETLSIYSDVIFWGQGVLAFLFTVHAISSVIPAIASVAGADIPFVNLCLQAAAWAGICLLSLHETDGAWAEMRFVIPVTGFLLVYTRAAIRVIEKTSFDTDFVSLTQWAAQVLPVLILGIAHIVSSSLFCFGPAIEYYQNLDGDALFVILALATVAIGLLIYAHKE